MPRMPLYHFATTNLPADTIAPEMSDVNVGKALRADAAFTGEDLSAGSGPTINILGNYLAYLEAIGFLQKPSAEGDMKLPEMKISEDQKAALLRVGGRGALDSNFMISQDRQKLLRGFGYYRHTEKLVP